MTDQAKPLAVEAADKILAAAEDAARTSSAALATSILTDEGRALHEKKLAAANRIIAAHPATIAEYHRRAAQMSKRAEMVPHFEEALRFSDAILVEAMQRAGGVGVGRSTASEIARTDDEAQAWGLWQAEVKRRMDRAEPGVIPDPVPYPPVPSWFQRMPGRVAFAAKLGIEWPE